MGLSWQQGPLGRNPNGQFLVPGMPERVLYDADPLEPPPDGRILVCCSGPTSELTLDL